MFALPAEPIPTTTYAASEALPGVRLADLAGNQRLPLLLNLTHKLFNQAHDHGIINEFAEAMGRIRGRSCMVMVRTRDCERGSFRITRWRTPDGAELVPPVVHEGQVNAAPVYSGGLIGLITSNDTPQMARLDGAPDSVMGEWTRGYRSLVATPLPEKSQPADWLVLMDTPQDRWTMELLETVVLQANLVGVIIRNLNIAKSLREATAYIQAEIDQIAEIQRSLLPQEVPQIPGVKVAAAYATFDRAGGDYYDVFPDPTGRTQRFGFLIADASGHGPSAAVVVSMLHTVLRNMAELPSPDRLLEELNRRLFARRIGSSFVTALAGVYDADAGTLEFAGAGHPPPLVHGAEGVRELEVDGGPPLGILDAIGSSVTTRKFAPGERVLLYTDGISEAMSPTSELFGVARVVRAMQAAPRPPSEPEAVLHAIDHAIRAHIGSAKPSDDQTALVLERR